MKIFRVVISVFIIFLLLVIYSIFMTYIKDEDFIGSYYSVNIKPDVLLEICGTSTGIIDQKEDIVIINSIDSMTVVDDVIYGISKNHFFLFTIPSRKVVYSSTPISHYSTFNLLSPIEYYKRKTMYIDIIGLVVLFCCIIITIKIVLLHQSEGQV